MVSYSQGDGTRQEARDAIFTEDNRIWYLVIHICPNESQPRTEFSREELIELSSSIQENGCRSP